MRARIWTAVALSVAGCALAHAGGLSRTLPRQPLADALDALARATGLQIIYSSDLASGITSPGASAELGIDDTLRELLRGTGLTFEHINDRAVTLVRAPPARGAAVAKQASGPPQADGRARTGRPAASAAGEPVGPQLALEAFDSSARGALQQVVVTGSHIPGLEPIGAMLIEISRVDIERSGYSTVQDVIRALPQSFTGGPSGGTHGNGEEELYNSSHAEGVNLRGLGAGSTLVLIDGHRIAPGAGAGRFVDVSAIPVSAIERIEILPEGASAIYGADAVGGVVNIILRDDYQGAETRMSFGTSTGDGPNEALLAQTLGGHWSSGSGLLTFEYWHRGDLPAADRVQSADSDLESLGGGNFDTLLGNPGTIMIGNETWAIPYGQNGRSLASAQLVPGTANLHNSNAGTDTLPEHERWSVVGTLRQELGSQASLFVDAMFSSRHTTFLNPPIEQLLEVPDTNPFYVNPTGGTAPVTVLYGFGSDLGPVEDDALVHTTNLTVGTSTPLGEDWTLTGYLNYAGYDEQVQSGPEVGQAALAAALADPDPATAFDPFGDGSYTSAATLASIREQDVSSRDDDLWAANLSAHGVLFDLSGHRIELAVGSEWRYETLRSFAAEGPTVAASDRLDSHVAAIYGELSVPLVLPSDGVAGVERAGVSIATRYESDAALGSALTPRFGLDWSPVPHLTLKSSWGRSFQPPDLADLDESMNQLAITVLPDPKSPTGTSSVLLWTGGNADLRDQTATTWTAGTQLDALDRRLTVAVTYFDIDYVGRIDRVDYSTSFLTDPIYAPLVTRDPTAAQRQIACSQGVFIGTPSDCLDAPVAALVDMRLNNVAATEMSGVDFGVKYRTATRAGDLDAAVDSTYLFAFRETQFAGSPSEDLLDTTGNPIDLRVRGTLSFRRGGFGATGAVNYFGSYIDTYSDPQRRIASWTTVDLQVSYDFGTRGPAFLDGAAIALTARNVLNANPPFVNNPAGVGYDPENADLLGRVLSIGLRKAW